MALWSLRPFKHGETVSITGFNLSRCVDYKRLRLVCKWQWSIGAGFPLLTPPYNNLTVLQMGRPKYYHNGLYPI